MRRTSFVAGIAGTVAVMGLQSKTAAASWPPGATVGGSYNVQPGEQKFFQDSLVLPDNFTLFVDPSLGEVSWTFNNMTFGNKCMIDLSRQSIPATPPPKGQTPGQPGIGATGAMGPTGEPGVDGKNGTPISITVLKSIGSQGSLWIRTDGQPGGIGGTGGTGQLGGGSTCGEGGFGHDSHNGGTGGTGGTAGTGGRGGDTSKANIQISFVHPVDIAECSTGFSPSGPPPNFGNNDGRIIVYGAPGVGGAAGSPGDGGMGGDQGNKKNCGRFKKDADGGYPGGRGSVAGAGPNGKCVTLVSTGRGVLVK